MIKKFFKRLILIILVVLFLTGGYFVFAGYRKYRTVLKDCPIEQAVERYTGKRSYLSFELIGKDFVNATVSVEDKRFFTRNGYDFIALGRALLSNLRQGEFVEGGSTITQQIAKNLYFHYDDTSLSTKLAQVFLLYDLEGKYSKKELFALYANMNYYGDGYYGLLDASRGYFHEEPSELSLAKSAVLAGIVNAPSAYQLSDGYELAIKRQHKVLETMLDNEYITQQEFDDALKEVIPRP